MFGVMIGDIVGSKYEFHNIKTKDFPLFSQGCGMTDDSIMTAAVASAVLKSRNEQFHGGKRTFQSFLVEEMQSFGRRFPNPQGGYGGRFGQWLLSREPKPYHSYGNGSAMRVSPCGIIAVSMKEAVALARFSATVTHDHPEGVKGAEAVAAAIFLAKMGESKDEIRQHICENYYPLNATVDEIRKQYQFDESCQGTVPQAITCFLESENFEDAIRNAVSIGGDSDTVGAITGSIAWTYYCREKGYTEWVYEVPEDMAAIRQQALTYIPEDFVKTAEELHEAAWRRMGTYGRVGSCMEILSPQEYNEWKRYEEEARYEI